MNSKKIVFCMTSDWYYDQRMQRISSVLSLHYDCEIVHRSTNTGKSSQSLKIHPIQCYFKSGPLFYAEFNVRLFFMLLFFKADVLYAVDADTLLAVGLVGKLKSTKYVYDSHEWFAEVPELEDKKMVKKVWNAIENQFITGASLCITVNESLEQIFEKKWQKKFYTLLNASFESDEPIADGKEKILLYQGALNKGRGLECAIMAMKELTEYTLLIAGDGDLKESLEAMVAKLDWKDRIRFLGKLSPKELVTITGKATFGLNLLEAKSKSYQYSLANKFFDYWQAVVPSINMDFPEYGKIINKYGIGLLLKDLKSSELVELINKYDDAHEYEILKENCKRYRNTFTWEKEEQKLLALFRSLFT